MSVKQYVFVIRELTGREIKRKYARSFLGVFWSVLNPLLSMIVLSLIFSQMFIRRIENFPIYYLTGITLWQMFTGATNQAMDSLVDNKALLTKVKLPKQIFPLSRVYTAFVNLIYSLLAYTVMLYVFKITPTVSMICFPVVLLLLLLFATGIGYILSIIYVYFADVKYLYSVILTLWMYMSALFYPVDSLGESMQSVVRSNPIFGFITASRGCVMYGNWPSPQLWIQMVAWSGGIFLFGILFFHWNEGKVMQKL